MLGVLLGTAESSRATKYSYRGSGPVKALVQKWQWSHSGGYVIRPRSRLWFLPCLLYSPLILSESRLPRSPGWSQGCDLSGSPLAPLSQLLSSLPSFHHIFFSPPSPKPHSLLFPRQGLGGSSNWNPDPVQHKTYFPSWKGRVGASETQGPFFNI